MSLPGGITVVDIPRGLSDDVIQQYFFSKGSEMRVFEFYQDARKAEILFQDPGVVAEILSSSHKIGRHVIKVTPMDEERQLTLQRKHGSSDEGGIVKLSGKDNDDDGTELCPPTATGSVEFEQWKFVSSTNASVVHGIETQARQHGVTITYPTFDSSTSTIIIEGAMPYVTQIKEHFEELKKHVHVLTKTLQYTPGLWTVLKSLKDSISLLEHDCNVSISIEAIPSGYNDTDSVTSHTIITTQFMQCNIEVCFGSYARHPSATSIINLLVPNVDQYQLHKLVHAGGEGVYSETLSRMRELSACVPPQVFEIKRHNLMAKKLVNCIVLRWDPSDRNTVKVLLEGLKRAISSSAPPCVVISQVASVQCPPVVLVELIMKAIESNSWLFFGLTVVVYVTTKEDTKSIEQLFQERHVAVKLSKHYKLLESSKSDELQSNMYIRILEIESEVLSCVSVIHGDLFKQEVQVYVNSTNSDLDLSRGVLSNQLLKLMGQTLQDQCNEYAPLPMGKVAVTSAKNMSCDFIFHVNLPSYKAKGSHRVFREAVRNILQICLDLSITSIAFPSLGTGKLGYPHDVVADIILAEVLGFNKRHKKFFERFVLVLSETDVYEIFMKVYAEKLQLSMTEKVNIEEKATSDRNSTVLLVQCRGLEDENVDVLINPISTGTDHATNPLVQALSKESAETLQAFCFQLVKSSVIENKRKIIFTKAIGKLRCKKICHIYNPNKSECDTDAFLSVILSTLSQAEKEQFSSLCMPLFGCGYTLEESATTIIEACLEFCRDPPVYLKKIVLVTAAECDYKKVCSCLSVIKAGHHIQRDPAFDKGVDSMNLQCWSWMSSKRRSIHPWDVMELRALECKDAAINVHCSIAQQGEMVIRDIESRVMKELATDCIKDDHVQNLIASEISGIKSYIGTLEVVMTLNKQNSVITLSGERSRIELAKTYVAKLLGSLKYAKNVLNEVVWQRESSSGDEVICEEICFRLENARMKGVRWLEVHSKVHSKIIDLKSMLEIELSSGKTYSIRRMDKPNIALPQYWQPLPLENGEEKTCHMFEVPRGTGEYECAVKEFRETMYGKKFSIVMLERVQNVNEYSKYCAFLDVLRRKYNGDVLMKQLFHGTSPNSVDAIAHQGFNRIFAADANAAVFGKGVYFASRANYSAQEKYSVPDEHGHQKMFICRVVVGKYTKGEKSMKVAPPLDASRNKHLLFDSLVDNVTKPTIFVTMSDSQAYPEYVVTFKTYSVSRN